MLSEIDTLAISSRILALIGGILIVIASFISLKVELSRIDVGIF